MAVVGSPCSHLREYFRLRGLSSRPRIDGRDETLEWQLGADRDEYHSNEPR